MDRCKVVAELPERGEALVSAELRLQAVLAGNPARNVIRLRNRCGRRVEGEHLRRRHADRAAALECPDLLAQVTVAGSAGRELNEADEAVRQAHRVDEIDHTEAHPD